MLLFSDLDVGDVFVLKWWLDEGPTLRHYLVVRRQGATLYVLRLEDDNHKLLEIDSLTFDESVMRRDLMLIDVFRPERGRPTGPS